MFYMEKNKPIKSYRAGVISLNVWENEYGEEKIRSYSFQRSYRDKTDKWQQTQTLRLSDLPKLMVLLEEAYKEQIISES